MNRLYQWLLTMPSIGLLAGATFVMQPGQAVAASNPGSASAMSIRQTQQQLRGQGYYHGKVDGVMGPKTRQALRNYQRDHSLPANGRLTRPTAQNMGVPTTGQYFESAGHSITGNYGKAGHQVAGGAKGMAGRMGQGEVGSGFAEFGKGIGRGAKSVCKRTANAAKNAYHGTKHALTH